MLVMFKIECRISICILFTIPIWIFPFMRFRLYDFVAPKTEQEKN